MDRPKVVKSLPDLLRIFAIFRVEVGVNIVKKLIKQGPNLRVVPNEELFDAIHEAHLEKGFS